MRLFIFGNALFVFVAVARLVLPFMYYGWEDARATCSKGMPTPLLDMEPTYLTGMQALVNLWYAVPCAQELATANYRRFLYRDEPEPCLRISKALTAKDGTNVWFVYQTVDSRVHCTAKEKEAQKARAHDMAWQSEGGLIEGENCQRIRSFPQGRTMGWLAISYLGRRSAEDMHYACRVSHNW